MDTERPEGDAAETVISRNFSDEGAAGCADCEGWIGRTILTPPGPLPGQATCRHLRCNRHNSTVGNGLASQLSSVNRLDNRAGSNVGQGATSGREQRRAGSNVGQGQASGRATSGREQRRAGQHRAGQHRAGQASGRATSGREQRRAGATSGREQRRAGSNVGQGATSGRGSKVGQGQANRSNRAQ